jgi:hypothetical protein
MKTQFIGFGSGLLLGLCLVIVSPPSPVKHPEATFGASLTSFRVDGGNPEKDFELVPIETFYKNISRYYGTHCKLIRKDMPQNRATTPQGRRGAKQEPSRMFIYSVNTLEKFFGLIKEYARSAKLDSSKLAIRFYYGVYPIDKRVAREKYESLHTLFMVPNYWSEHQNRYVDLDIKRLSDDVANNGYPNKNKEDFIAEYYLESIYNKNTMADPVSKARAIFMLDASAIKYNGDYPVKTANLLPLSSDPPVINQGQLCPPACPTSTSLLDTVDDMYPGGLNWNQ